MARAARRKVEQHEHQAAKPAAVLQFAPPRMNDPDLIDRIFDYVVAQIPEIADRRTPIERAIRSEFGKQSAYVRERNLTGEALAVEVARLFDGRNATEVARVLQISRATVYRLLKQPGRD